MLVWVLGEVLSANQAVLAVVHAAWQ
jgi:hypothetical protein